MREVVSNTSPLLYLHQIGSIDLLPALYSQVLVPASVVEELAAGRAAGHDVPNVAALAWARVVSSPTLALLALATDPNVWVSFDPDGRATSFGGTLGKEITLSAYACRMGHWTLVATVVHELAHVGGVHGPNNAAEATLKACLMRAHYNPYIIGSLSSSERSNTLVAANRGGSSGVA
jgi:hypothetical protein